MEYSQTKEKNLQKVSFKRLNPYSNGILTDKPKNMKTVKELLS